MRFRFRDFVLSWLRSSLQDGIWRAASLLTHDRVMGDRGNGRLVYSTGAGRICPGCGWPERDCKCSRRTGQQSVPARIVAKLRVEKKGRGGKTVTVVDGLPRTGGYFYFVNSYYAVPAEPEVILGATEYGHSFCSVVARDNIVATQFHAEKSGQLGLRLLENFARWDGRPC